MQKRAETACNSPPNGGSCFWKKAFAVFGTVFGGLCTHGCPFLGVSCFRKKGFPDLGTVS